MSIPILTTSIFVMNEIYEPLISQLQEQTKNIYVIYNVYLKGILCVKV